MKSKKILTLIFAVLLVFSLFGCGKKEPVADVEPQDTVEQEKLTPVVTEKDTPKQEPVELTQEELHALFKKEYEFFKWAKANLYDDQYQEYYLKLPAREIGTQTDANVYADIEKEVAKPEYEGKILPDDGFEQYVAWREAYMPDNNQQTGAQKQEEITGIPDENTEEPFDGNDDPSLIDKDSQNVYEGAVIEREVTEAGSGKDSIEDDYDKPSYEIVG